MEKIMFVDAETDGLYGQVLSIGAIVIDDKGNECEQFYMKQKIELSEIKDEWVKENVYFILGDGPECETEDALLEEFWKFYIEHSECNVIADVPYPVECSLFHKCVLKDEENRKWLAPFPLMDLSSMLFAKGIDPQADRKVLLNESIQQHNALEDVRMSIAIYEKYINK